MNMPVSEKDKVATSSDIALSKLQPRHLEGALKLSQEFSWPYRIEDWEFAARYGQGVVLERAGEVLGTALWWCYGDHYATTGMIIVTAKMQGGGLGSRLFDTVIEATQGRNTLLNATAEGLPLYLRRGFSAWGKVLQHQAVLDIVPPFEPRDDIRAATDEDLRSIQDFDERATGMPRQELVKGLFGVGETLVLKRNGSLAGFAIARRFGRGYVVGPVASNSVEDAKALILAHLSGLQGHFVRIDVYEDDGLSGWLESLGLTFAGDVVSMVRGARPEPVSPARMYAIANQSLS